MTVFTVPNWARVMRGFGMMPLSQLVVLALSTASFALLARVLGPLPYARYAYLLLVFTVSSLVTDLAPQSYLLVHGRTRQSVKTAARLSAISATAGVLLLCTWLSMTPKWLVVGGRAPEAEYVLLSLALIAQVWMQTPRAKLILAKRYGRMAASDIAGTAVGIAFAVGIALGHWYFLALPSQFAAGAVVRSAVCGALAAGTSDADMEADAPPTGKAIRYGIKIMPLNLATYLGRSIDSGLLPAIVPAAAAASYARSYQVAIVPIAQVDFAIGPPLVARIAKAWREGQAEGRALNARVLGLLEALSALAGLLLILASPVVKLLLFGPAWPNVEVTISAMACCLPGISLVAYGAWTSQVVTNAKHVALHFVITVIPAVTVVTTAVVFGYKWALVGLVVSGGLVQPLLLVILHRRTFIGSVYRHIFRTTVVWAGLAAGFVCVGLIAGDLPWTL